MAIELSTAGAKIGWAMETTPGTKPTAYTRVRGVKSIPELNPEPETIEVTDLNDIEYKRYIPGLKDLGGALPLTSNLTEEFMTDWDGIVEAHGAGKATGKRMWVEVYIPGLTKAFFMVCDPTPLGISEIGVGAVLETNAYLTPVYVDGWATKVEVSEPGAMTP